MLFYWMKLLDWIELLSFRKSNQFYVNLQVAPTVSNLQNKNQKKVNQAALVCYAN